VPALALCRVECAPVFTASEDVIRFHTFAEKQLFATPPVMSFRAPIKNFAPQPIRRLRLEHEDIQASRAQLTSSPKLGVFGTGRAKWLAAAPPVGRSRARFHSALANKLLLRMTCAKFMTPVLLRVLDIQDTPLDDIDVSRSYPAGPRRTFGARTPVNASSHILTKQAGRPRL